MSLCRNKKLFFFWLGVGDAHQAVHFFWRRGACGACLELPVPVPYLARVNFRTELMKLPNEPVPNNTTSVVLNKAFQSFRAIIQAAVLLLDGRTLAYLTAASSRGTMRAART